MIDKDNRKKKTVLIADDSDLNRELLCEMLGEEYDYLHARDGEEVLAFLSENIPADILLLDMNMPNMNGMDVLKVMKERRWIEELPVVVISAIDDMNFVQNSYRLGAIDYIIRPFDAFLVQHRVKNTLALYSQNKRLMKLVENQVVQREKMNNMLINIFSHVVEIGNHESGSHTLRVQFITNLLLNQLVKHTDRYALSETDIAMISSVAALHDIGKITVPDEILNKPGKLTPEEWVIMKSHTINGDKFLSSIPIDQNEKLMITAHEVCRHHHERYDGNGYPDGLAGDEIPISAQTVSLADVYDALTSDRCYKKAFSHEEAVSMILKGECGAFNPLLLQCFEEISDDLLVNLNLNSGANNYENNARILAGEVMEKEELYVSDRSAYLAECERSKKEFFAAECGGIQFEYDAVTGKVLYIHYYNNAGRQIHLSSSNTYLLNGKDWNQLKEKISRTTRENPIVTMEAVIPVDGEERLHKLTVQSIWVKDSDTYVGLVGHFIDIQNKTQKEASDTENPYPETPSGFGYQPDKLIWQSYYQDTLTKAYSRAYMDSLFPNLEQADAIAVVDINQFKTINERHGHEAGDKVLVHIASILRSYLSENDVLIRYGGDEFLLVFKKIEKDKFFEKIRQIKQQVTERIMDPQTGESLSISIGGVYEIAPFQQAVAAAEKAMYQDKYQK